MQIELDERKGRSMHETTKISIDDSKRKAVDTVELQAMLGTGRKTAVDIGMAAGARIQVGRRVLWNVKKVERYLDSISE